MNLRDLRYFVSVAESGSILAASERLHIAQPSISLRIKVLEAELGVTLFDRRPRGVLLTSEGTELLAHARVLLDLAETARESLRRHASEPVGTVNLGVPTSLSAVLCVPLVEAVLQQLPNVKLRIVESMSGHIVDWLRGGQLELGLVFGDKLIAGIHAEPLLTEELYIAAASKDALAPLLDFNGDVPFEALAGVPLILPTEHHGLRTLIDDVTRLHGLTRTIKIEIDSFLQIQRLVQRDLGMTILSLAALHDLIIVPALHTGRIIQPSIRRTVSLACSDGRSITKAAREVGAIVSGLLRAQAVSDWWHARPIRRGATALVKA